MRGKEEEIHKHQVTIMNLDKQIENYLHNTDVDMGQATVRADEMRAEINKLNGQLNDQVYASEKFEADLKEAQ